jgi:hypothetical protein
LLELGRREKLPDAERWWRRSAPPILPALETGDQVKVATFDLSPNVLEPVHDGELEFAMDQQQHLPGYLPAAVLALNSHYGLLLARVGRTGRVS